MKKLLLLYFALLLMLFSHLSYAQTYFASSLTSDQTVPGIASTARGTAVFNLTENGLNYIITVDSISKITAVQLRIGAVGDTGAVAKTVTASFRGNTASGTWTASDPEPLNDDMIRNLLAGKIYLTIQTQANPGGEIRGQVQPITGTSFRARFSALEVVPSAVSGASGTATFLLTDAGLAYWITATGLNNISGSDFRIGAIGENGESVQTIAFNGNQAAGIWTKNDPQPLTDRMIRALLLDSVYITVKTAAYPEGEIRGQVFQSGGILLTADISGSQEVPATNSVHKGTGYFNLTPAGLVYMVVGNINEEILEVRLMNAPAGMTGDIVKTLTPNLKGKIAAGVWTFTENEPLTNNIINELLKGNIYINYMTAANPNGEIRGQLMPVKGVGFTSILTGSQVRPASTTKTLGVGAYYLDQEGLHYNITLFGTDTIKSAHIYSGKLGVEIAYNRRYYKSIREFHYLSATGIMRFADTTEALTPALAEQLLKDEFFVNIRTTRDTLSAIRGQLIMTGGTAFRAALSAKQEVPAVKSNASGTANFLLTNQGLSYQISVDSITVASSHFHLAPAGKAGGVVKDITSSYTAGTASGTWLKTGDQSLTSDLIKSLLTGNIYVNVHSPAHPSGEIRGQVVLNDGWGFAAQLNGVQVVPSVSSTGAGTGAFILTPAGVKYDLTLTGVTPVQTTINNAPVSQNGPVIQDITAGFNGSLTGDDVLLFDNADSSKISQITSLLSNNLYVSVNTAAFANGEIRGQISRTVTGALVSVKSTDNILPGSFELKQNYPNPFNPSTKIKFSIPEFSQVELTVFNILGEKLFTLVNKEMSAGNYEVQFDALRLPSGMYIYRLQTGKFVSERKMMLIK